VKGEYGLLFVGRRYKENGMKSERRSVNRRRSRRGGGKHKEQKKIKEKTKTKK